MCIYWNKHIHTWKAETIHIHPNIALESFKRPKRCARPAGEFLVYDNDDDGDGYDGDNYGDDEVMMMHASTYVYNCALIHEFTLMHSFTHLHPLTHMHTHIYQNILACCMVITLDFKVC